MEGSTEQARAEKQRARSSERAREKAPSARAREKEPSAQAREKEPSARVREKAEQKPLARAEKQRGVLQPLDTRLGLGMQPVLAALRLAMRLLAHHWWPTESLPFWKRSPSLPAKAAVIQR